MSNQKIQQEFTGMLVHYANELGLNYHISDSGESALVIRKITEDSTLPDSTEYYQNAKITVSIEFDVDKKFNPRHS